MEEEDEGRRGSRVVYMVVEEGGEEKSTSSKKIRSGRNKLKLRVLIYISRFRQSGPVRVNFKPNFNYSLNLSYYPNWKPNGFFLKPNRIYY